MNVKRVVIRPEAESDIKDAYQWYESQRKGLGESFLLCIEEALSRVARNQLYIPLFTKKFVEYSFTDSHLGCFS